MNPPRCFISYSWDNDEHRDWVRKLATRLRECGVDAILDQWHCAPGTDLTKFMEQSLRESNYVILVCTPNFCKKADSGVGGVGYEKAIVTGEIFAGEVEETKFVPVLRAGDAKESLPSYLKSRLFIDFHDDQFFEDRLEELLRHFHGEPRYQPPPIGPKPDFKKPKVSKKVSVAPDPDDSGMAITNELDGYELVKIPAGSFLMGSPKNEKGRYDGEGPQHDVQVPAFYLGRYPVTNAQYELFLKKNPKAPKPEYWANRDFNQPRQPVVEVSWEDAQAYARWAGLRLPTEAEWEYACRAGTNTRFFSGDTEKDLAAVGWYGDNSEKRLHPVGEKTPNTFGLYDMHGNVWEWVEDDWHSTYDKAPTDGNAWVDNPRAAYRVVRGGSWYYFAHYCRSATRRYAPDFRRSSDIGFRLARSVALCP
jgi:formylglycine-generating enzyme required for sulfatase activity